VDLLLSSETLYRTEAYPVLCSLIRTLLKPAVGGVGGGVALFASKRHYFGVGGGSDPFSRAASAAGLTVRRAAMFEDGKSMTRDILEVRRPA
jgi:hypothetical protein